MKKLFVLGLLLTLSLFGCEQNPYQIVKGENGNTYRLNKKTGEMSILKEDKLVPIKTPEQLEAMQYDEKKLEDTINWKEIQILGKNLYVKLQTSWREGVLYYKFYVYPYSGIQYALTKPFRNYQDNLDRANQSFTIQLLDKNGFVIKAILVDLISMTEVVNALEIGCELMKSSSIECSKETYESIGNYNIQYLLKTDLMQNQKPDYRNRLIDRVKGFAERLSYGFGKDEQGRYIEYGEGLKEHLDYKSIHELLNMLRTLDAWALRGYKQR